VFFKLLYILDCALSFLFFTFYKEQYTNHNFDNLIFVNCQAQSLTVTLAARNKQSERTNQHRGKMAKVKYFFKSGFFSFKMI